MFKASVHKILIMLHISTSIWVLGTPNAAKNVFLPVLKGARLAFLNELKTPYFCLIFQILQLFQLF